MVRGIPRSVLTANQREWYSRGVTRRNSSRPMNLMRLTLIDPAGGVSFVAHGEALPALLKACASNPRSIDQLLERVEPYYHRHQAPARERRDDRDDDDPDARVVGEPQARTREASLRPVKAGALIINLIDRRIVQLQNGYQEITRTGRGRIFDGERLTNSVFTYRLPNAWALVP